MTDYDTIREAAKQARAVLGGMLETPIGTAKADVVLAFKLLDDALKATEKK